MGTRAAGVRRAQAWITGLRAQYAAMGSSSAQPSGFGGFGKPQLHEHFNEALDIVDEPVYRSLGGLGSSTGGFAVDEVDVDMPGSHEAWMQSMPPLVQRQSAFSRL